MSPAEPLWRKLPVTLTELCIDTTLRCGQSFRWRKVDDQWHCSLHGRVVSLRQDDTHLHYRSVFPPSSTTHPVPVVDDTEALLVNYFNLGHSLAALYSDWSARDANFRTKAPSFAGVRILNQDAWEALVAFICSSNNNIARISQMVHRLCDVYGGPLLATVAGFEFRDFPDPRALAADGVEARLRELGFGYRARYIAETARVVALDRSEGWLLSLRNPAQPAFGSSGPEAESHSPETTTSTSTPIPPEQPNYPAAHAALVELSGVGPKVADCVCLMGLGWGEAVPLDTHMWTIAARDYGFGGKKAAAATASGKKTVAMSKGMYDAVGKHFRDLWGSHAGWAHSVLFTANLRAFSDRLGKGEEVVKKEEGAEGKGVVKTKKRKAVQVKEETETETRIVDVKVEETDTSNTTTMTLRRSKRIRA